MEHGIHRTFEISGEVQYIDGKPIDPPGQGPRFGRIFPHTLTTPPFTPDDSRLEALGQAMTEEFESGDSVITAGYTYFGQFIDHDITRDDTALLTPVERQTFEPELVKQLRSPSLDLDSLYGKQGDEQKFIGADGFSMRTGNTTAIEDAGDFTAARVFAGHDIPRDKNGAGDIGDDRNDENLFVQQTHTLFLRFHNKVAAAIRAADASLAPAGVYSKARDLVTRHYQWLVLNDFVRRFSDPVIFSAILGTQNLSLVDAIEPNPLVFKITAAQTPPMPLEFSVAAYRMGHSMVRESYIWNRIFNSPALGDFRFFFRFTHLKGNIGRDGGTSTFPSNWVADWRRVYPMEDVKQFSDIDRATTPLNRTRKLDTHLAPVLGRIPSPGSDETINLAASNLRRGSQMKLQCGQDIADAIIAAGDNETAKLTPSQLMTGLTETMRKVIADNDFHIKTPLWFYILKEAELSGGSQLGRVGSRIVIETFLALIRCSRTTIFSASITQPGKLDVFSPAADSPLRTVDAEPLTSMAHLIAFVGDVNPLGDTPGV
ncbi:hypothetical protein JJB09_05210 [Rhizobium sp. KVB221]|uniref:Heme peroxidase n=1 Tax=Rhizobium setariae TaxID=2801340 RepID=A0A937CJS5_9HYPH|nr:peroxidase family protein [Rhizobium setariae]MBL0371420.1 hypothetical protein [Rhizobium setariae]